MGEEINLTELGWEGLVVPPNLSNLCRLLPKWNQLKSLRDAQTHGHHFVHFPHNYFYDISGNPFMPALEKGDLHNNNGGYSQIFKAKRSIYRPESDALIGTVRLVRKFPFEESCIKEIVLKVESDADEKECIDEINAIVYEAFLHALIDVTLTRVGLGGFVPHLHEVVALTISGEPIISPCDVDAIWMSMEFMDGTTLEKYLAYKFNAGTKESNTALLKDILIQLAYVLDVLQAKLFFNHRDLKLNNLYVKYHPSGDWVRSLNIPGVGTFECKTDLVMIDFGFSCVACGTGFINPRATLLGAGSYLRPEDDCLKRGRDLAQFLYSLHCSFPLQNFVTPAMFDLIHNAMRAERRGILMPRVYDLFMGLDAAGNPLVHTSLPKSIVYNDGIYIFLRDNSVDVPGCTPMRLISALSHFHI